MSIPISFMLNFTTNVSKAAPGVKQLGANLDFLSKATDQLETDLNNMGKFAAESLNMGADNVNILTSTMAGMNQAIRAESLKTFGEDMPASFENMMRGMKFDELKTNLNGITETISKMYPEFELGEEAALNMFNEFTKLNDGSVEGAAAYEKLTSSFSKFQGQMGSLSPEDVADVQKIFIAFENTDKGAEGLRNLGAEMDKFTSKSAKMAQAAEDMNFFNSKMRELFSFIPSLGMATRAITSVSDAVGAQDAAVKTMQQMGMYSKNLGDGMDQITGSAWGQARATNALTNSYIDLGSKASINMQEAAERMNDLASLRVTNNIEDLKELGLVSANMGHAFGMSSGESAEFIRNLKVIGQLSNKEIKGAADAMANVQHQMGLNSQEASEVATQVGFMTRRMKGFGGTVKDVKSMTEGVAKMQVAFKKAGLEASQANDLVNRMMDPSKIEDNVLLWQGLGMSVQDGMAMMMGDTDPMTNMNEKMVQLAKDLKSQYGGNAIALQEMASQYGMSLEQVSALSALTEEELKMNKENADLQEQANKARQSMQSSLSKIWDSLNVIIQGFVMPLLNALTPIAAGLANLVASAGQLAEKFGPLEGVIRGIMGALLFGILIFGKRLIGVLLNTGKLGGIFGKLKDKILGATKGLDKMNKASKGQKSGLLDQLSKMKPQQILAVGAALLMVGIAVALIVGSLSLLVKAVGEANLGFTDFLGIALILGVAMAPLIVAMALMGTVAGASAGPLLAFGAGILLVGIGIALIILSVAHLIKSVGEAGAGFEQLLGVAIVLAVALAPLILAMIIMGSVGAAAAPGMLAFGAAILMAGAGIALIMLGVTKLVTAIGNLGDQGPAVAQSFKDIAIGVAIFSASALLAAGGAFIMAQAIVALVGASAMLIPALIVLAGAAITMGLLAFASSKFANNLQMVSNGIAALKDDATGAVEGIKALKAAFDEVGKGFGKAFADEIALVTKAIMNLSTLTPAIVLMGAFIPKITGEAQGGSGGSMESGGSGGDGLASLIGEGNTYLDKIADNTSKILERMGNTQQQSAPPPPDRGVGKMMAK